ncbi:MAG TPA: peptidoglycan-associated lipoprotein Pal [Gemmatimonadaceae bacterium]|nr:peptidoglycan-associated lipoprotein Pal [Gemmatimonadaceae bacterium]
MRTSRIPGLIVLAAVASVAAACGKKPAPAPPPAPAPAPRVNQDSIDRANKARADSIARAAAAAEEARRAAAAAEEARRLEAARAAARNTLVAKVYFDLDKDEIRDDQRATLDAKVPILNANPDMRIMISGNTDDRGSDEYNLALGQRRAASVRRYLASRGIAENRMDVQSFGEQRPVAQGEDEAAWSQNRRAEFEITAGGNPLKVP